MNLENGWLGLASADPVITFPAAPPRTMIIQVDAQVQAPTYFMRVLGYTSSTLRTRSTSTRRFVNLSLVLDRSTSLELSGSCDALKTAATDFAKAFVNGQDKLALVTFGTTYRTDFALANDFLSKGGGADVPSLIDDINCAGYTNAASGYSTGFNLLNAAGEAGALNVIVFFTDGEPTAVHLPGIPITGSYCTNKSNRNGVVASVGSMVGINIAYEPNAPSAVPASDWNRPVDDNDADPTTTNPDNANCKFKSSTANLSQDTSRLTGNGSANWLDAFGNSLTGSYSVSMGGSSPNKYITLSNSNIENIATNALVSAASRARTISAAAGTDVVTYAIGLGNTATPPDAALLQRIANVQGSSHCDSSYPEGQMIYASNADQLQSAFSQLASELLRLSQ
jgi:hypothetical protein